MLSLLRNYLLVDRFFLVCSQLSLLVITTIFYWSGCGGPSGYARARLPDSLYSGPAALVHRYTTSRYYSDYRKSPKSGFVPGVQYCPRNGMTVCEKIKNYPRYIYI